MKMKNVLSMFLMVAIAAMVFSSCKMGKKSDSDSAEKSAEAKELLILYPNWAEGIAFTHLAKVALDDKGYAPEVKPIEPGIIYASLAKGDADLFLDAWLPNTHADYWEKYGDKLVKVGEAFSSGTTGIVVPSYVTINSITDMNANKAKFDGKIIGIGSGAGIHANTEKAIEAYNLDFEQITSSGAAMVASLKKAVSQNKWIAITGWKPHYMWAQYDLKYLDDPKGVYPADVCAIVSRKGFAGDFPKLEVFFKNFNLPEDKLYELMDIIEKSDDPESGAQKWYDANKAMVNAWWGE